MKTRLAVACALLVLCTPVLGAHWKPVGIAPDRSIYMDVSALVRKGNAVQAWDWQKFAIAQSSPTLQGSFYWVKSLTSYHCTQRTTDPVLQIYLGNDGVELKRAYLEGLQFPATVEPDSLREKMLEMACNSPKPVAKRIAIETKPAAGAESREANTDAVAKLEPSAVKADPAVAKSAAPKVDSKPAKAEKEAIAAAPPQSAIPVVRQAQPVRATNGTVRQARARALRVTARKKAPAAVRLARSKPQSAVKCPSPEPIATSVAVPSPVPAPLWTDAGNDGVFN